VSQSPVSYVRTGERERDVSQSPVSYVLTGERERCVSESCAGVIVVTSSPQSRSASCSVSEGPLKSRLFMQFFYTKLWHICCFNSALESFACLCNVSLFRL